MDVTERIKNTAKDDMDSGETEQLVCVCLVKVVVRARGWRGASGCL